MVFLASSQRSHEQCEQCHHCAEVFHCTFTQSCPSPIAPILDEGSPGFVSDISIAGKRRVKVEPCPTSERTAIEPLCNCRIRYAIASPMPLPSFLVEIGRASC